MKNTGINEFNIPTIKMKPQLFMGAMVRQLLAGNKTTTSRLPTCTNSLVDGTRVSGKTWKDYDFDFSNAFYDKGPSIAGNPGPFLKVPSPASGGVHRIYSLLNPANYDNGLCLWVRENFAYTQFIFDKGLCGKGEIGKPDSVIFQADIENNDWDGRWKPNIHMPFDVCRLFLKVTGFKMQRIQDISAEDAIAEGIDYNYQEAEKHYYDYLKNEFYWPSQPIKSFASLWQKVHPGSWERNDWVWSPHFEKIEKPV